LAGAYIRCAQRGIPILVDGFICAAAALIAIEINETIRPWLLFSHCSAERGHRRLIEQLDARPLLNLDLRLGEGSGAAVAVPLLRMACALHNQMASFESAGVSRE
jgi:nicotinate-nucleotide--dimethylbenzimidazole phosphoribosyltransferase